MIARILAFMANDSGIAILAAIGIVLFILAFREAWKAWHLAIAIALFVSVADAQHVGISGAITPDKPAPVQPVQIVQPIDVPAPAAPVPPVQVVDLTQAAALAATSCAKCGQDAIAAVEAKNGITPGEKRALTISGTILGMISGLVVNGAITYYTLRAAQGMP